MIPLKTNRWGLALTLLITGLVYFNSLNNPLVIDDRDIIFRNFRADPDWKVADVFRRTLFATDPSERGLQTAYFRPLTLLTFGLNYSLAGENPAGYRIVNIAFHLLVTALVFLLLSRLADRRIAAFATLLFALHPAHVQAVSYISSRSDPLYTLLALLSLLSWAKSQYESGRRMIAYRCGALLSFLLGLFAKETMIVVPVLALLLDCSSEGTDSLRPHLKQKWKWYAGFLLCFALYLSIRIGQGFPLTMEDSARPGLDPISRLLVAPKLIALYLGIMAYPAELHVFRKVDLPQSPFDWQIGPGILLLAFILASAKLCWEKQKHISVGILWFVIAISPVLGLLRLNADVMEHWLYLPSIGLALAFVGSIKLLAEHVGERRGAAIALVLIALLFSARTVTRNAEWGSLVQIFSQNVTAYPTHPSAWVWLGDALKNQGRWNEAVKAYEAALALDFSHPALVGLADALLVVGKGIEGEVLLTKAASASPDDPWLLYILGFHRLKLGKDTAAIEALEKNISLEPSVSAYHLLGSAYLRIAAQEKAERAFEKALALEPEKPGLHASIHLRLGNLYRALGRSREARDEQRIALRFAPDLDQAKALLAE